MAITHLSGGRKQGSSEADIPLGDGLKAYWHLDESSGTTATNDAGEITGNSSIGTAGNLTLTDVTLAQSGSPTNFGTNADFDGSTSMGECGAGTEANFNFLHDGSDWSVSFWAKMDATGSNQHIIDNKGAVGDYENGLDIRTMTTARWRVVGTLDAGYYVIRNTSDNYIPDTTNFHHYVMTWDNSTTTVTFYRDGANKETGSGSSGASGTADEPLVICGHAYDSASSIAKTGTLNGKVCELAIWNTVLTDAQVSRIYNGGDGRLLTLAGVQDDKTTITNVPVGTRFEETDTRKIFRRKGLNTDLKAYWTLSEAGSNLVNTATGTANLGTDAALTVTGSPAQNQSGSPSGLANNIQLDGTDDWLTASTGSNTTTQWNFMHNSSAKFSISFWARSSSGGMSDNDAFINTAPVAP